MEHAHSKTPARAEIPLWAAMPVWSRMHRGDHAACTKRNSRQSGNSSVGSHASVASHAPISTWTTPFNPHATMTSICPGLSTQPVDSVWAGAHCVANIRPLPMSSSCSSPSA
eukprot:1143209-Pelagomonas_calceolata.AAC.5